MSNLPVTIHHPFKHYSWFIVYCFLLLLGGVPLMLFDKTALFLHINRLHHPLLDSFFLCVTWLGSRWTYATFLALGVLISSQRKRILLLGGGSFFSMSLVVQILKRFCFAHVQRPVLTIPATEKLHIIADGLTSEYSFPSGHAATAFTLLCLLHFLGWVKHAKLSFLLFILAALVAYSRIYLCFHFYGDVYTGAWIGMLATGLHYALLMGCRERREHNK